MFELVFFNFRWNLKSWWIAGIFFGWWVPYHFGILEMNTWLIDCDAAGWEMIVMFQRMRSFGIHRNHMKPFCPRLKTMALATFHSETVRSKVIPVPSNKCFRRKQQKQTVQRSCKENMKVDLGFWNLNNFHQELCVRHIFHHQLYSWNYGNKKSLNDQTCSDGAAAISKDPTSCSFAHWRSRGPGPRCLRPPFLLLRFKIKDRSCFIYFVFKIMVY